MSFPRRALSAGLVAGLAAGLAGCPQPSQPAGAATPTPSVAATPLPQSSTPATPFGAQELEALWQATEGALQKGQSGALNEKLDVERLALRAAESGGLSAELLDALRAALRKDPPSIEGLLRNLPEGGTIAFLRGVPGQPARIRLRRAWEGGFDYVDLLVERSGADFRVVDLDLWKSEPLSLNISSTLARGASQGRDQLALIHEARLQASGGDHAQALKTLDGLPATTAALPSIWIQRLKSCAALGPEPLAKARAEFERACPDAPALLLWSIARGMSQEDFAGALEAVEALDARVGGDPHLWIVRAAAQQGAGDPASAKRSLEKAVQLLPEDVDVHFELIDLGLAAQDWALVAKTMSLCEERFGIEWPQDLATAPDYESFRTFAKSAEYEAWRKR